MINTQPDVIKTGRYTQSEAAMALGICRQTMAKYEKQGLIGFKVAKPMMRKVTTGAEIIRLWIRIMK